jgi:hypothetical protein
MARQDLVFLLFAPPRQALVARRITPPQSKPKPQPTRTEIAASLEASGAKESHPGCENLADSAEESCEHTKE